jgi:hypothetical protein
MDTTGADRSQGTFYHVPLDTAKAEASQTMRQLGAARSVDEADYPPAEPRAGRDDDRLRHGNSKGLPCAWTLIEYDGDSFCSPPLQPEHSLIKTTTAPHK